VELDVVLECLVSQFWLLFLLPVGVAFAAAMDLFTMTIPNRISVIMVVGFIPAAWYAGLDIWGVLDHLAAGLIVLAIAFGLFARGVFGGGDAKLLAAISLWVGLENLLSYMFWVALVGGLLAVVFMIGRQFPLPRPLLGEAWAHRLHNPAGGIPYGVALAVGALLVYPQTVWFHALAN
jgi:prepilin peptidase CpaA